MDKENEFLPINEIIEQFTNFEIVKKWETLKKLAITVTYNTDNQSVVFKTIFANEENFTKLTKITFMIIEENKIKKYLLSIFFNLILSNENNFLQLKKSHFDFLIDLIKSLNYEVNSLHLSE